MPYPRYDAAPWPLSLLGFVHKVVILPKCCYGEPFTGCSRPNSSVHWGCSAAGEGVLPGVSGTRVRPFASTLLGKESGSAKHRAERGITLVVTMHFESPRRALHGVTQEELSYFSLDSADMLLYTQKQPLWVMLGHWHSTAPAEIGDCSHKSWSL